MSIEVREASVPGGRVIDLGDVACRPSVVQQDEIMRVVSEALGGTWMCVSMSGYWVIGHNPDGPGWHPVYGHRPGEQTRRFDVALSRATGLPVVLTVSARKS